jgi:uncharacterized Zn finger protein
VTVLPSRESAAARARRLLAEGRVTVLSVRPHRVYSEVRGDSGRTHAVVYTRGRWTCPCEARTRCAHQLAVMLVVDLDRLADRQSDG